MKETIINNDIIRDRIRGSLIAGAAGDALGYEVEFSKENEIFSRFGEKGITEYSLDPVSGKALISDDTQMTLFTATGIIAAEVIRNAQGVNTSVIAEIEESYFDWLITQKYDFEESRNILKHNSPLYDVPGLFDTRAPGITCLNALEKRVRSMTKPKSYIDDKVNTSKGCGGVMRVAPLGLCFPDLDEDTIDIYSAEAAAVTHSHPLGYMTASVLSHIVHSCVFSRNDMTLKEIVIDSRKAVKYLFNKISAVYINELDNIISLAVELSENNSSDLDNIHRLGEGWIAEEALAIAIYCALRYHNDISAALIASVNHKGDSDSTGAIAGNILGAWLGFDAIDDKWKKNLELSDIIIDTADDLWRCSTGRYDEIKHKYL